VLHFHFAENPRRGASLIHRLDPRVKILGTLLFILAATLAPPGAWVAFVLLLAGDLAVSRASELGAGYALKRSFVALPFALAAITLPFTVPGQTIAQFGSWTISAEGSVRFLSILVKSWISVQMAILLSVTTAFPDLLWGLRALRIPKPLVGIVGFMFRYLFVLTDESQRLMRARTARAGAGADARKTGGSWMWRGRVAGGLVGNLALRAFERSERIYDAMMARGFQGEIKTLEPPVLTDVDRNALVGWVTYLGMVLLIGFVF
jgi:cobalt/nickel transport system permease protein